MSHVQAICQVTIDNPHANGMIVDGGWGWMIEYPVNDHRATEEDPDRFAAHPEDEWDTSSGGANDVEVIPGLKALAPRGVVSPVNMDLYDPATGLGRWDKTDQTGTNPPNLVQGWRAFRPQGLRADFLLWYGPPGAYDATTSFYGEVTTKDNYLPALPNFVLHAWRKPPPPDLPTAGYNYLEIQLGSDGFGLWSLGLPGPSELKAFKYPVLGWRKAATDSWTRVKECNKAISASKVGNLKPYPQRVTWETVDNQIVLDIDGTQFVYWVPEYQRIPGVPVVQAGPVRVTVYGARAAFNISHLTYSTLSYAQQRYDTEVDTTIFNTGNISCYDLSWEPESPNVTATVTVTEEWQATDGNLVNTYLPRVTFRSDSEWYRAVCYLAQLDIEPSITGGVSSTYVTQGKGVLVTANGDLSSEWRNARCKLVLEVGRADADALVAAWKGNNKVTIIAGWDDGATTDTATHFTGYLVGRPMVRDSAKPERVEITLNLRDGFHRLEKKRWLRLGNMTGWQIHEAYRRALNHWGIADALIQVWDTATSAMVTYASFTGTTPSIPLGDRKGELRFDFAADAQAITCLNELVEAVAWRWGYDRNGYWFLRPTVEYNSVAGADFLIDDDTVSEGDMPLEVEGDVTFDATPDGKAFANNIWVEVTRGDEAIAVWKRDGASHTNSAAADFIGDDWWEVQLLKDGPNPEALAERILAERTQRQKTIRFRPLGQVDLWPDMFVEWDGTGIGLTANSIFRVTSKKWECQDGGRYTTTFEGVFVQ